MGREVILFKSKERKTAAEAATMLRQAADKLETGTLTLTQSGESLEMTIPDGLTLQIKAEEETGRSKTTRSLEFELEWTVGEAGDPQGTASIS